MDINSLPQDPTVCDLVPAAAITYAGGYTSDQPIIFTTQNGCAGEYTIDVEPRSSQGEDNQQTIERQTKTIGTKLEWIIAGLDVLDTRDWSTSEARISLTVNQPDPSAKLIKLPDLSPFRGGNRKSIGTEDEIRIYIGYIPIGTLIDASMLDEYPYEFTDIDGVTHTPTKPLRPVFWGFIDKVDQVSSAGGGTRIIFSCRDRTRIFADTRIISIPSLQGSLTNPAKGFAKGERSQILMDLANSISNTLGEEVGEGGESPDSWKPILPGLCFTGVELINEGEDKKSLQRRNPPEDPQAWINTACFSKMEKLARPRFHRWVERPPLTKGSESAILQVQDKTPLEIIDYLAKHEESPMDFYCSKVNGDFIFGPRILDFSGFDDASRHYRTYFYRASPDLGPDQIPSNPQRIMEMRAVSSTLATFNKFIILDDTINGSTTSFLQNIRTGVYVLPWGLKERKDPSGRNLAPPPRAQIIHDGALDTYENPQFGALMVGLAASRIMARDLDGIQLTVLGDPTLQPGEAIRVYNSIIHDDDSFVTIDPSVASECLNRVREESKDLPPLESNDRAADAAANPNSQQESSKKIDRALNGNGGRSASNSDLDSLILPTYKIRSIQHSLISSGSKLGYTSNITATCDL
jgi:hypothetical protein